MNPNREDVPCGWLATSGSSMSVLFICTLEILALRIMGNVEELLLSFEPPFKRLCEPERSSKVIHLSYFMLQAAMEAWGDACFRPSYQLQRKQLMLVIINPICLTH